jgi:tRNA dimethylallyltransferase
MKLLIVCGPTATGKTALALRLAKKFHGELVSADSRQVYRGMDIGTGKDLPVNLKSQISNLKIKFKSNTYIIPYYETKGIRLWMVDVVDPDGEFSVAHYEILAHTVIEDIRKRGKLPIVVGGTGLYIKSLLSPIETSYIPPDKNLRKTLEFYSLEDLQEKLQKEDSSLWDEMNTSDRLNPRRLIRKIEIARYKRDKDIKIVRYKERQDVLLIGLTAPHKTLYKRIDERVEKRIKQGIINEIKTLLEKGYSWDLPSMNTFGYKEWKNIFFLTHNSSLVTHAIERWKYDEHAYARRQMTWFKSEKGIVWFDVTKPSFGEEVEAAVKQWYTTSGYA